MAEKTYTPTDGMASAARRALQWKKEGKRGGTTVGLARANQLAKKESLSASTVMRMHSFFSRHAVDKKAKGFNSGEKGFPSPGRVAWDLWGGDAGASWSKQKRDEIVNNKMNKSVWSGVFFPADEPALTEIEDEGQPLNDVVIQEPVAETIPESNTNTLDEPPQEEVDNSVEEVAEEPDADSSDRVQEEPTPETAVAEDTEALDTAEEHSSEPVVEQVAEVPAEQ